MLEAPSGENEVMPSGVFVRTKQMKRAMRRAWRTTAGRRMLKAVRENIKKAQKVANSSARNENQLAGLRQGPAASGRAPRTEMQLKALARARTFIRKTSRPHKFLVAKLLEAGLFGLKVEYPVFPYHLDIAFPGRMLAIECDGSYWHSVNKTDYAKREKFLRKKGWRVLHVESDRKKHIRKQLPLVLDFLKEGR